MFYLSPKHHFDTMFVIICVIAGATSHTISNTSKTSINQSSNRYPASFIDFIMDTSLIVHLKSLETNNQDSLNQLSHHSNTAKSNVLCARLSNILTGNQLKICQRHRELLITIIPQIYPLIKKECLRISAGFRWNCSLMDLFLDKSSPLASTREAALVRSILNASMMYLIVKTCSELNLRSCGCRNRSQFWELGSLIEENRAVNELQPSNVSNGMLEIEQHILTSYHLSSLKSGTPLKLTRTLSHHQGCTVNVAFAEAFTRLFTDSHDLKTLTRANKILNQDRGPKHSRYSAKLRDDSDERDLARIKWGKAAINLHNSNLGRQIVHEAIYRKCRCHGLSGVCQFRTCWDYVPDIQIITLRLRSIYIISSFSVQVKDMGTFSRPDLSLFKLKLNSFVEPGDVNAFDSEFIEDNQPSYNQTSHNESSGYVEDIHTNEFIYLYKSPDYCDPLPYTNYPGTKDRACSPKKNSASDEQNMSLASIENDSFIQEIAATGFCDNLCCRRGYRTEIVMEFVNCNCKFEPCCRVECDNCPRQRLQHFCL